jgi:hypothetical protein
MVSFMAMVVHLVLAATTFAANDPRTLAHDHFAKGIAAFNHERFGEAAEEFEEAYRLSPSYKVLYNIGQVDVALGKSVEAIDAFERYLQEGKTAVSVARQQEVREAIAKEKARIGSITVRTEPTGADIRLDGRVVGSTPLDHPILVTIGPHTIEATIAGRPSRIRDVQVVGGGELDLEIALEAPPLPEAPKEVPEPTSAPASVRAPQSVEPISSAPRAVSVSNPEEHPTARTSRTRNIGYALGILGLTAATAGGVLVFASSSSANSAVARFTSAGCDKVYDATKCGSPTQDYNSAKSNHTLGWWIAGAGAAALVAGVALVIVTPNEHSSSLGLGNVQWIAASPGGLSLGGSW